MIPNDFFKRFIESNDTGDLQDLRRDLILEIGAGVFFVAWIIMVTGLGFGGNLKSLLVALVLFICSLGGIGLRQKNFTLALACLMSGMLFAAALHQWIVEGSLAQFFYPIVVVTSGLLVSNLSVFLVAFAASLVCVIISRLLGYSLLDPINSLIPLLLIYLTAFAAWLSSRQIHSALGWMQTSYSQARTWLEQLRDERMAQARTIKILEETYVRIEKMNYLLLEARSAAEEARRLKAEFAANISHELRTPLNIIIGFSETMANAPETYTGVKWTPTLRGDIEEIYRSSRHLSGLIDDILDLSALEVKQLGLDLQEADLRAVITEATGVVKGLYQAKQLYLKVEHLDELPPILMDATRIRQVLINLLSNASRFTSTGGVTITTALQSDSILVSIADTGIGIAKYNISKVFQEFGQVDGSLERKHEGTGLGVPLSKHLVEMHGGKMWLESEPGLGSTFYFTLPWSYAPLNLYERVAPNFSPLQTAPSPKEYRKSVLVIESDALLLRTMRRHLSAYDLVEVKQYADLPAWIEKTHPVALVIDRPLNDAAQTGWEKLVPPGLPILCATFLGGLRIAEELGIVDYLLKPVSREQLVEAIQRVGRTIRTILIVDDDVELVDLFCRMLESAGSPVGLLKATGGREAFEILSATPVDLVLADLFMPEGDGMELLKSMKADPRLAEIPVIMISGQYPPDLVSSSALDLHLYRTEKASLTETLALLQALLENFAPAPLNPSAEPPKSAAIEAGPPAS